jgi:condensation domain-containing protein
MKELNKAIQSLTPRQRALLEKRLSSRSKEKLGNRISPRPLGMAHLPLSFAQQRLWFFDRLQPENSIYNVSVGLQLKGLLNVIALEQAVSEISRRHEVLRITLHMVNEQPAQVINQHVPLTAPLVDLSALKEQDGKTEEERLMRAEARRPFDLRHGPMLRFTLLRTDDYLLWLTNHHIVGDEWSSAVFVREFKALYEAFLWGEPSPLPALAVQYADFAIWQRERLRGDLLKTHLSYWMKTLKGAPSRTNLPTDRPRPSAQTFDGGSKSVLVEESLSRALKGIATQFGVTAYMLLLAAFNVLMHYYSGQDDLLVGSPIANRNQVETEALIGFFVNTLVLRIDLSGDPTFKELLGRVRETVLGALSHQDLPFEKIVDEICPERSLSHNPLFQVSFALNNVLVPSLELPNLEVAIRNIEQEAAHVDLILHLIDSDRILRGSFQYNIDLFDAETADRMIEHYERILRLFVDRPEAQLSDFRKMLADADRQRNAEKEKQVEQTNLMRLNTIRRKSVKSSLRS